MNIIKITTSGYKLAMLIRKASKASEIIIDYGCGTNRTYKNDTDEFYVRFVYEASTEREITIIGDVDTISMRSKHVHTFFAKNHRSLHEVDLSGTDVSEVGITGCTNLSRVLCSYCPKLAIMNLADNAFLMDVQCENTVLNELNLANCSNLRFLNCMHSQLNELDLSDCLALEDLNCMDNDLDELDLSKNRQLSILVCRENDLCSLDLKNNIGLVAIDCGFNQLKELDVSNHHVLKHILCKNSCIRSFNISGCVSLAFIKQ